MSTGLRRSSIVVSSTQVPCDVLTTGVTHLISQRLSNHELTKKLVGLYNTGYRLNLDVTLPRGRVIEIMFSKFDLRDDGSFEFEGTIPNGGKFARVHGHFTGNTRGSFSIVP